MTDLSKNERAALEIITRTDDPVALRNFIANARRQKSIVVERAAFTRLCAVMPEATPGTVEYDVWQSIHALEEMLRDARGKTVRLSRTRQKIKRDGEAKTAADLTLKKDVSAGFSDLIALGHPELTFEAVVLRHPLTFDAETLDAAARRLVSAGLDPAAYSNPSRNNGG